MRHASASDLEQVAWLLEQLRKLDGLKEKNSGTFHRRSRAFLHFHEHEGRLFADVRLATEPGADFERVGAHTKSEQRELLKRVHDFVQAAAPDLEARTPGGRGRR